MNFSLKTKIIVTGGHLTPALAVVSELINLENNLDFVWVGHKYNQTGNKNPSAEFNTVTNKGIKFYNLNSGKLVRDGSKLNTLINLLKIPLGFVQATYILLIERPKLILSFGGYIALPIVIMGKLLGSKVVVHEQTVVSGLTNRILPTFANKVLVSWENSFKYYPKQKTVLTGNPIRPEIFINNELPFAINTNLPLIYITGGNLGSHKINSIVLNSLNELRQIANIVHQTGNNTSNRDYVNAKSLQSNPTEDLGGYVVYDYVGLDLIGTILNNADLLIGRSGANTVYEVLALGLPSLFIPIPWVTHNEQYINALQAQNIGLANILTEFELTEENFLTRLKLILPQIKAGMSLNGDLSLEQVKQISKQSVILDASSQIAQIALQLIK